MKIYKISDQEHNLVVYHGSEDKWKGFDNEKQLSGYYRGFYVTTDENIATQFGGNVNTFYAKSLNLYTLNNDQDANQLKQNARKEGYYVTEGSGYPESKYLEENGYDGIKRGKEIILFNPEQVLTNV